MIERGSGLDAAGVMFEQRSLQVDLRSPLVEDEQLGAAQIPACLGAAAKLV